MCSAREGVAVPLSNSERQSRYCERHPDRHLESQRKYRSSNKYRRWLSDYLARPDVKERSKTSQKTWRSKPGVKEALAPKKRELNLMSKYGITLEEYDRMFTAQDGVCAVCRREDRRRKNLSVDHDHVSGRVRGLLCMDCNVALGLLEDDHGRIVRLAAYMSSMEI